MDKQTLKSYTVLAGLVAFTANTLLQGWQQWKHSKVNTELYEDMAAHSEKVHNIAKKKSDLPVDEQIEAINQAQMLIDLSMYGQRAHGELERGDIVANEKKDMLNYLSVKASTLHRDMHQEIRRRSYDKYTQFEA